MMNKKKSFSNMERRAPLAKASFW